jgi:hypothetical protein
MPWDLRNECCIHLISFMNFIASHIYICRESNHCADKMARIGLTILSNIWWNDVCDSIGEDYTRIKLSLPYCRFINLYSVLVWPLIIS